MQWICGIAMFLVVSGIILELIADTKYYKYARWVTGVILLMQFIKPLAENEFTRNRFYAIFESFDYALGTDKVLEEIYNADKQAENSVLSEYKAGIVRQMEQIFRKNGLKPVQTEISVAEDGTLEKLWVKATYLDGTEQKERLIPTVVPVRIGEGERKKTVSPFELYIRGVLAEYYQMEESNIEVVIQEE